MIAPKEKHKRIKKHVGPSIESSIPCHFRDMLRNPWGIYMTCKPSREKKNGDFHHVEQQPVPDCFPQPPNIAHPRRGYLLSEHSAIWDHQIKSLNVIFPT